MSLAIRLIALVSAKHVSHGFPVWAPFIDNEHRRLIYKRLDDALSLLKAHAPSRYERVKQCIEGVLIFGVDSIDASYLRKERVCRLSEKLMLAPDTTAARAACALVHEATHGHLLRLGIPYDEPIRHRVELACIKASLLTAHWLPGAEVEVERCRRQISFDPSFVSNQSFKERAANNLRALGWPQWTVRALVWVRRRGDAKRRKDSK